MIEVTKKDLEALDRVTLGNQQAAGWLLFWREYVHSVDDDDDEPDRTPADRCRSHALALEVYNHPFYVAHRAQLEPLIRATNNAYCDAVQWEKSEFEWQRDFADVYRHFGGELVLAVAEICANEQGRWGYEHKRSLSFDLRTYWYLEHHDAEGKPI